MRLVTYNIQYTLGKDDRFEIERIAGELRGADVVALQEVERFWLRSGLIDQAADLARLLTDYYWIYGANLDVHGNHDGAGPPEINHRRQFGNMILSKSPILSSRNFPLPKSAILDRHSLQRGALEAVIDTKRGPVRFYSLHLDHLDRDLQLAQIEAVLGIHGRAPREGGAWCGNHKDESWTQDGPPPPMPAEAILLGDFNMTIDAPGYESVVGPPAPGGGRVIRWDGFVDAWVAAGQDENDGITRPWNEPGKGRRIDYCFVSASLADTVRGSWIDTAAQGSDHQPLWVDTDL